MMNSEYFLMALYDFLERKFKDDFIKSLDIENDCVSGALADKYFKEEIIQSSEVFLNPKNAKLYILLPPAQKKYNDELAAYMIEKVNKLASLATEE